MDCVEVAAGAEVAACKVELVVDAGIVVTAGEAACGVLGCCVVTAEGKLQDRTVASRTITASGMLNRFIFSLLVFPIIHVLQAKCKYTLRG
jgi:predicted acyltransferase